MHEMPKSDDDSEKSTATSAEEGSPKKKRTRSRLYRGKGTASEEPAEAPKPEALLSFRLGTASCPGREPQ